MPRASCILTLGGKNSGSCLGLASSSTSTSASIFASMSASNRSRIHAHTHNHVRVRVRVHTSVDVRVHVHTSVDVRVRVRVCVRSQPRGARPCSRCCWAAASAARDGQGLGAADREFGEVAAWPGGGPEPGAALAEHVAADTHTVALPRESGKLGDPPSHRVPGAARFLRCEFHADMICTSTGVV